MQKLLIASLIVVLLFNWCYSTPTRRDILKQISADSIFKIEMNLSAFGVESDDFPSMAVFIDLVHDSSYCTKSYYNPAYKGSVYHLMGEELKQVTELLKSVDLANLKSNYTTNLSDQPTSTTIIYTTSRKLIIKDYGLVGEYPLNKLYKIVYKL